MEFCMLRSDDPLRM